MTIIKHTNRFILAFVAGVCLFLSCGKAPQASNFNPDRIDSIYATSDSVLRTIDSLYQAGAIGLWVTTFIG